MESAELKLSESGLRMFGSQLHQKLRQYLTLKLIFKIDRSYFWLKWVEGGCFLLKHSDTLFHTDYLGPSERLANRCFKPPFENLKFSLTQLQVLVENLLFVT